LASTPDSFSVEFNRTQKPPAIAPWASCLCKVRVNGTQKPSRLSPPWPRPPQWWTLQALQIAEPSASLQLSACEWERREWESKAAHFQAVNTPGAPVEPAMRCSSAMNALSEALLKTGYLSWMVRRLSLAQIGNVVLGVTGSLDCTEEEDRERGRHQLVSLLQTTAAGLATVGGDTDPGLELRRGGNLEQVGDRGISLSRPVGTFGHLQGAPGASFELVQLHSKSSTAAPQAAQISHLLLHFVLLPCQAAERLLKVWLHGLLVPRVLHDPSDADAADIQTYKIQINKGPRLELSTALRSRGRGSGRISASSQAKL
jgi:hypothetical protein